LANQIKLLHIEDSDDDAMLVEEALDGQNIEYHRTSTLSDGIKFANEHEPDVIVLDLGLPDHFGIHTYRIARANIPQSVPIIISSGQDDRDFVVHALMEGARDYVIKGVSNYGTRVARAVAAINNLPLVDINLTLYISITTNTRQTATAIKTVREFIEKEPNIHLSVIDVDSNPDLAEMAKVLCTPSLVLQRGSEREIFVGDLSDNKVKQSIAGWLASRA
jgi:PleD family two-component response regulator